ncbi:alpha-amylase family glycosyl hydrolase [Nannocystis punicea]|uniref:Alpha-amylase family glycosyl hydrolase n=1 Tax=Nannocystis punicea TaxID=2995304 RepID=A0ABY7HEL3_9BACT|nr:alpha-amylase family glycosyl hydrolase [Nannocystis poenicansa]WAS97722.1 alpha-amylase family glycosyl hydrolase [Nannocystis poenicansa]
MARSLRILPVLSILLVGCTDPPLESETTETATMPPSTMPYDPSMGGGVTGYATGGQVDPTTGGEPTTGEPPPPMCDDALKRCDYEFTYPDMGETSVEVMGSFAPDGWTKGAAMKTDGTTWRVTVPVPWDTSVQYKLRIDGSMSWIPDPNNPDQVDDGFGGYNSVLQPMTCEMFSCEAASCAVEQEGAFDWRDSVIYFVFVDRFNNGDPGNDALIGVETAADWQGGDWAGVTAKIEEGYFTELGVNTLWLTVPMNNTSDDGIGTDGHLYSAYHGYWPTDLSQTEEHFGSLAELQALVTAAHAADLKVILDYAMNHVHVSAPVYAEHPDWFNPNDNGNGGDCVCGAGCSWDGADGERCWFTDYLPDFNFSNQAARDYSVNNALQWIKDTGVDGFRLDAVKHIKMEWLTDLRARVKADVEPMSGQHFYMVGETFTGDKPTINKYVGCDKLDGQFDFPLRMQMAYNVLMRQGSMTELADFIDGNNNYYNGGAAVMSTFIGNHDIPRAIHLAEDTPVWNNQWADGKDKAWNDKPGLPGGAAAFERLGLAFTILYTTLGAPLVYYGDEVGMPGAGDPDNRRFMQWDGYSSGQSWLLGHVQDLGTIRAAHPALRRGSYTRLGADADSLAYSMAGEGETVSVAVNRSDAAKSIGGLPAMALKDELTGEMVEGPTVMVPARSARILVAP